MPVNSFENYILTWKPDKTQLKSPLYLSLAQQMEQDIEAGLLSPGAKLPPQRELADYLDVSLNTITRAYTLCEKRGLIYAATGRGTFVNSNVNSLKSVVEYSGENVVINLGVTVSLKPNTDKFSEIVKKITADRKLENNIQYASPTSTLFQLEAAREWLDIFSVRKNTNILITNGSQNSLTLILTGLFEAGDKIVVDQYTYPNFLALANMLHIVLLTVPSDEKGMDVEELKKILNTNNVKGIYLSPSCTNPQAICMPHDRRIEIAQLINQYNIILIEDDCYAFMLENKPQPIFNLINENGFYITELNKAVCPAIKTGFICYDKKFHSRLQQANYNCNLTADWFSSQVAAYAIKQKIYQKTIKEHMEKNYSRNKIYQKYFPITNINSYYQWLQLPQGISSTVFESVALKAGIKVYGSERFLTGDSAGKYYLRISTSGPHTDTDLETALMIIKRIITDIQHTDSDHSYTV
ncbi:MAG: PLP-dependent aminotransferase family protein [Oscillospiraceae bacterium]|nr:PLP-dependent aminotransferase family protein [Oscillospiraceae bacterium]